MGAMFSRRAYGAQSTQGQCFECWKTAFPRRGWEEKRLVWGGVFTPISCFYWFLIGCCSAGFYCLAFDSGISDIWSIPISSLVVIPNLSSSSSALHCAEFLPCLVCDPYMCLHHVAPHPIHIQVPFCTAQKGKKVAMIVEPIERWNWSHDGRNYWESVKRLTLGCPTVRSRSAVQPRHLHLFFSCSRVVWLGRAACKFSRCRHLLVGLLPQGPGDIVK